MLYVVFADSDRDDEDGSRYDGLQFVGDDRHRGASWPHDGRRRGRVCRHQLGHYSHIGVGRHTRSVLLEHKRK